MHHIPNPIDYIQRGNDINILISDLLLSTMLKPLTSTKHRISTGEYSSYISLWANG
jgi:hypothetical protein